MANKAACKTKAKHAEKVASVLAQSGTKNQNARTNLMFYCQGSELKQTDVESNTEQSS